MDFIKPFVVSSPVLVLYVWLLWNHSHKDKLTSLAIQNGGAVRNVFFLHTHKTGGTTVNNLLRRMAVSQHLTMALFYRNPWPDTGLLKYIINHQSKITFQILYNHVVYNKSELEKCMSRDRLQVTLLRHPLLQLKSLFNFLQLQTYFNISASGKLNFKACIGKIKVYIIIMLLNYHE